MYVPLKFSRQMDLVAVDDGFSFLIRRHKRGETADDPLFILHDDVSEIRGLHLGNLLARLPPRRRSFIVGTASLLDETIARV